MYAYTSSKIDDMVEHGRSLLVGSLTKLRALHMTYRSKETSTYITEAAT